MFLRTRFSDRCQRALPLRATAGFCLALTGCLLTASLRPASAHELTNITVSPTTPVVAAVLAWTSSNPAVATIDDSGRALAISSGSSTIGANYGGRSINTLLTVPADVDSDSVPDNTDNCTLVANASQCDSDSDGYGNHCDGDLNNNTFVNSQDYILFRSRLGVPSGPSGLHP